ncbi:general substrate transporter [Kockovaella imperatae]|uniref:General substrate transporter n=1 Tax=Kockovaella imperatae TaxID=4999 RepID=A0A1Y1UJ34_9TREE|nr:general substrate transporter [Kockovaella imperatae]ORX38083.1 general substrate transporter [Kockovaella imperatae]
MSLEKNDDIVHIEGDGTSHPIDAEEVQRLGDLLDAARKATESEHKMTVWQAVKRYPKASAWSIAISFGVVMEGFDVVLLGNFYAYPEFQRTFGVLQPSGDYQIPAPWQAGLSNASACGSIIGLMLNGYLAERIGYRYTMIASLAWLACFIFLFFFAKSLGMLVAAEVLCGIPWGILQTLTTSYASEVAPLALRGFLTTWVNACWGIGQLLSVGILRGLLSKTYLGQWGWRIPYALQWIWPVPLILVSIFAPESPWWLVRKGRIDEARQSLARLTSRTVSGQTDDFDIDQTVAMMQHTNLLERRLYAGASYIDCFKGVNLRRTEISVGCWAVQVLSGVALPGSAYFLQSAGLPTKDAFTLTMCNLSINIFGVMIAWALMGWGIGRRSLYLYGCFAMNIVLWIVGGIGFIGTEASLWAIGGLLLGWQIGYQFTLGTVCFSLITEFPSRRLLIKTVNIGRAAYNLTNIIFGSFTPFMINPSAWDWGTKASSRDNCQTAFFAAGMNTLALIWIYFRLPEPSGLSYAEIDKLFEERIPARQFQKHRVVAVEAEDVGVVEAKHP